MQILKLIPLVSTLYVCVCVHLCVYVCVRGVCMWQWCVWCMYVYAVCVCIVHMCVCMCVCVVCVCGMWYVCGVWCMVCVCSVYLHICMCVCVTFTFMCELVMEAQEVHPHHQATQYLLSDVNSVRPFARS